ncbi:MAG: PEP-CTERM sorting domain-containing protein [Terriglobia bacterium]
MKRLLCTLLLAGLCAVYAQADPTLQLIPAGGVVAGAPGSTVGWGFMLTNTSDYLVVTGSSFTYNGPQYGTYQDIIGTDNFIVVGPAPESTTVTQDFNPVALTGVGEFTIDSTAPFGAIKGTLAIDYSLFSVDPNDPSFNPDTDTVVADASLSQAAAVDATPEPASIVLMATGLILFEIFRRRARLTRLS